MKHNLGVARHGIFASQPVAKIVTNPEPIAEAMKKWLVSGRLMSLSATYFQGSAMAATGEWTDGLRYLKVTFALLDRAVRFLLYLICRGYIT